MIKQAALYFLALVLSFSFPMIYFLITTLRSGTSVLVLEILTAVFYPIQGFFNFIFYIRPGFNHVRKMNPSDSILKAIYEIVLNFEAISRNLFESGKKKIN